MNQVQKKLADNDRDSFTDRVYAVVKKIPRGKVATYAAVARALGNPRAARAVGNALNKNPHLLKTPCHRVVRSDGSVGGYARGTREKIRILRKEGVKIEGARAVPAMIILPFPGR